MQFKKNLINLIDCLIEFPVNSKTENLIKILHSKLIYFLGYTNKIV